jgi:hypothetical protein
MKRVLEKNHADIILEPYNEGISNLIINLFKPTHHFGEVSKTASHIFEEVIINNVNY